jgi:hypothetical protein
MRQRVLSEAECYARCYGQPGVAVQVIADERQSGTLLADVVRQAFEELRAAREPEAA